MLKKAITLYLVTFILGIILSGCCNCNNQNFRFRWKDLKLSSRAYTINAGSVNSVADTGTNFAGKGYLLQVFLSGELIAANHSWANGLVNQAYACKCAGDSYQSQQSITQLRVFTVNDYDSAHPAMSDVTEHFKSPKYSQTGADGLGPLYTGIPTAAYHSSPGAAFELYLDTKPTIGAGHQFKVVVALADGSIFSGNTPILQF